MSHLFQQHLIKKIYQAIVVGELKVSDYKEISTSLDDKEALTQFWVREVQLGHSLLEIELKTGRLHQIRRHLSSIKLPILGDPLYGKNNKNQTGMKLLAYSLSFKDPWSQKNQEFKLPEALKLSSL